MSRPSSDLGQDTGQLSRTRLYPLRLRPSGSRPYVTNEASHAHSASVHTNIVGQAPLALPDLRNTLSMSDCSDEDIDDVFDPSEEETYEVSIPG